MAFFHLPLSSLAAAVLVLLVAPETSWTMSLSVGHRPTLLQQRQQDADFDCARLPPACNAIYLNFNLVFIICFSNYLTIISSFKYTYSNYELY